LSAQEPDKQVIFNACPHCGHKLSPWQQVLLSVDRALTCRNCWYRLISDLNRPDKTKKNDINKGKTE